MSTSSGSRVRLDGTMATSSNPYARRAVLPMPISMSMPTSSSYDPARCSERPPGEGQAFGTSMGERYQEGTAGPAPGPAGPGRLLVGRRGVASGQGRADFPVQVRQPGVLLGAVRQGFGALDEPHLAQGVEDLLERLVGVLDHGVDVDLGAGGRLVGVIDAG